MGYAVVGFAFWDLAFRNHHLHHPSSLSSTYSEGCVLASLHGLPRSGGNALPACVYRTEQKPATVQEESSGRASNLRAVPFHLLRVGQHTLAPFGPVEPAARNRTYPTGTSSRSSLRCLPNLIIIANRSARVL